MASHTYKVKDVWWPLYAFTRDMLLHVAITGWLQCNPALSVNFCNLVAKVPRCLFAPSIIPANQYPIPATYSFTRSSMSSPHEGRHFIFSRKRDSSSSSRSLATPWHRCDRDGTRASRPVTTLWDSNRGIVPWHMNIHPGKYVQKKIGNKQKRGQFQTHVTIAINMTAPL